MTYDEWEESQRISPSSPEAYYAELAWNVAIQEVLKIVNATANAETTIKNLIILQNEEINHLDTGFRK